MAPLPAPRSVPSRRAAGHGRADGTLGGVFMGSEPSLLSSSCGPTRDSVLGANWVLADGSQVRTGARVVKSVAGYDVTRLLLGSRGQLAINTSLILRLRPAPRRVHWLQVNRTVWSAIEPSLPQPRLSIPLPEGDMLLLQYADFNLQHPELTDVDHEYSSERLRRHLDQLCAPLPEASQWLSATAEACAPGAPHFGRRP